MGEALDMVKGKMKLGNKDGEGTPRGPQGDALDTILDDLDKEELTDAKRTNIRLRLRERDAEMRARIRELENQTLGNKKASENSGVDPRMEAALAFRKEVAANAKDFLDAGVNSETVAKYLSSSLTGLSSATGIGVVAGPASVGDIPGLVTAIATALKSTNGGTDPKLLALMEKLTDNAEKDRNQILKDMLVELKATVNEVKAIKSGTGKDGEGVSKKGKIKVIKPDHTIETFDADEPIVLEQPAAGGLVEPIESIREKNRHAEKMEELKADREWKKEITTIASEIPERIGAGAAQTMLNSGGGGKGEDEGGGFQYIECEECHSQIPVLPGNTKLKCAKCGMVYTSKTVEVQKG